MLTNGESLRMKSTAMFALRTSSKGVGMRTYEQDVSCGVLESGGSAMDAYRALVTELYLPVLREQSSWGKNSEESTAEFLSSAGKFSATLTEAVGNLQGGIELKKPEKKFVDTIPELKPNALSRAAADNETLEHFEHVLENWCKETERLLDDGASSLSDNDDVGPDTELEFWRNRLAKFNSITEQLKSKECKLVIGVTMSAKTKSNRVWKTIDIRLTDAANEAKDNVKYLTTLEKSLEPMYEGTPNTIIDTLPTLMNNIKMMHTIARYYSNPEQMTTLFVKITNQMITNCKQYILSGGKLWDQDKPALLRALELSLKLNESYQEQYKLTRDRLLSQPSGKQFDFNEQKIFGKFDLFCKRLQKLHDMFTTMHQFSTLAEHTHIDGLEDMIKNFFDIADDMKKKPYDLLDFFKSDFDRDFIKFNINIHELETTLQGFINLSFENITSTEHALNLLRQFQSILQRDLLKADLDDKYMAIFQNYGLDLETVQKTYEKFKNNPPLQRNASPVAGNIMWSRQLLRRIEEPMKKFSSNKSIMATKESKKIVKTYNRVAKALIEFETLWLHAWTKSIESAKQGLSATLIVRHPDTGNLLVNFDKEIMQLMKETKYLIRLGSDVPDPAKMVLLQEDKLKYYYNQLTFTLQEYNRVTGSISPLAKPLLAPHIDDLDKRIQPGMYVLTWTSMNIDGYLHRIHNGIAKLELLVKNTNDIIDKRIEANLKSVSKTMLVYLPNDRSFTYDEFVGTQVSHIKRHLPQLSESNREIERAVNDLLKLVREYPRDNVDTISVRDEDMLAFTRHYGKQMYQAILLATRRSFKAMKKRLGSKFQGGFLFVERPFFDVDVELTIPHVSMNPSLDDIQKAINNSAKQVLMASKHLKAWGQEEHECDSFFDLVSKDISIVKSVLLLTGSIEGLKSKVVEYIGTFSKYGFLWKSDLHEEYNKFMKRNPNLEDFEPELKKYMVLEKEISLIPPVHNIGALSLETQPMKYSLKSEATSWKSQFASNLHIQGHSDLEAIMLYMKETRTKLSHPIEDLQDVRVAMDVLKEIREKESEIDSILLPIEEMYALLLKYEDRVPKEEIDLVGDLRYSWKKLRKQSVDVNDNLSRLQVGFKRELVKEVKMFVMEEARFKTDWETNGPIVPGLVPIEAVDRLSRFSQQFALKKTKWENFESGEILFGLPVTQYPHLAKIELQINDLSRLYDLYTLVIKTINEYSDVLWTDIVANIEDMTERVGSFQNQCKKLPKALREWQAYLDLRKKIEDFSEILPLLNALSSTSMRNRHWQEVMKITGKQMNLAEDIFKLQSLLEADLLAHREELEELAAASIKEEQIETKLGAIRDEWSDLVFTFQSYKSHGEVILSVSETAELIEKLDDSQMQLGSMATNRYSTPFKTEVQTWNMKLSTVSEIIEMWLGVQNMWMYMEAVFCGGDIVKQLPLEAKRFQNIDKNYMKIVTNAIEVRNVVQVCYGNEMMKNILPHLTEQLESCQKSLTAFLDTKRAEFPRFYFVSDPTLLEILSLGSDPQAVQQHFQSGLFDSIASVSFDRTDKFKMTQMHSKQGESTPFLTEDEEGAVIKATVQVQGNIEVWLQKLVDGMQETMRASIKHANDEIYEQSISDFLFSHPAQVGLLGFQFMWTASMQAGLAGAKADKTIMSKTMKKVDALLKDMIALTTRPDLTKLQRTNLETVITVHMHQRDTSDDLVKKKIKDPSDFEWMKQARFYWKPDRNTVIISICDVDFEYSFEYLGVKERLVITPLTDICYVTLSQALGMFLGGAPAGPAGTGKTETVKDLGNTLGKYVVVFNCSDQMDYKGMGKIYRGLAQSGLWGCFDEFNRINLDVLSVCAQQVFCVLQAIRDRKDKFVFTDGNVVSLDSRCGFFITMNPGYAGRQELPENLKSLFRGVTMMVPNRQIIMKVKLAACGYQENDALSKKFFVLYGLCEQQLSKQAHYDFGLRNILSVLRTMGQKKRDDTSKTETYLVMRTLRDMNMSKFVAEDVPLFLSLIDDLFPGLKAEKAAFPDIDAALRNQAQLRGLQNHERWLAKCIQLYETLLVRHGIMLVGPTGGGKTMMTSVLASALTELGTKHQIWKMNPKAITAPQMFGRLDAATGDWTEGVFAALWRKASQPRNSTNTWIVLDGPVDAIWIENLNTVLDDNRLLTLANGDRISMTNLMKLMFEPENLNNASPATVSRAGIIYVSETELGWHPLVDSWISKLTSQEREQLRPCFTKFVQPLLDFIKLNCVNVMPGIPWEHVNRDFCSVTCLLSLLDACLLELKNKGEEPSSDGHVERIFIYCVSWALGGLLTLDDRKKFDAELRKLTDNVPAPSSTGDTVFEYLISDIDSDWIHWDTRVPTWEYPQHEERPKFAQLVIPTLDSVRYESLLGLVTSVQKQILLVGGPGTAKTTAVNSFLQKFNPEEMISKSITFSSLTTPNIFQCSIEGLVEKRQGRTFGPPGGKKMAVFIDDLSMPTINKWGDQITNEIVRQLFENKGMYSLDKPIGEMKTIIDTVYIAAMTTPGAGKNDIPNRLKRHFCSFYVPLPSIAAINNIFGSLMAGRFDAEHFDADIVDSALKLVPITVTLWNKVQETMLPTPAKFHYLFNMRELSKVFQGLILASRDRFDKAATAAAPSSYGGKVTSPVGYLVSLWRHECERVFCDKLTNNTDKEWTTKKIKELVVDTFGSNIAAQTDERVYYVDFLRDPEVDDETGEVINENPSFYESVDNLATLRSIAESKQHAFNEKSRTLKLELVLFNDALEHLTRITRILSMDRGSGLLVGVGGSGKQSLTRLAAYISGAYLFQITVTKTYNQTNLFEDVKGLYKLAGLKAQKVAFLFTDSEVKEEGFLEYINQILMTGEVAGLFPKDELDLLVNDMRPIMKKEAPGIIDTWDNLYNFFLSRVRDNLHVILCFSPVGVKFSQRASQFPGLINGCTIDWFLPWPIEALTAVSTKFVAEFSMACGDEVKEAIMTHMGCVHTFVTKACSEYFERFRRHVYVTPKSYLSFLNGYKELYSSKLVEVKQLADKINNGLGKLKDAKEDVRVMKGELAVKKEDLAVAQKKSQELLKNISSETAYAEKEKAKVNVIVEAVRKKAGEIAVVKEDAENDLAAAQPALDAAVAALNSISPKDIGALKALKNPPDIVKRIFDTVLILRQKSLNEKVEYADVKGNMVVVGSYDKSIVMMSDIQFLTSLMNFPKEEINDETIELLQPYFQAPDFNFESAKKASGNVAGLCNWSQAMATYHDVAKVVEPKINTLRDAEGQLKIATKQKDAAEKDLATVQASLDKMQAEFDAAMAEKQRLEQDAVMTQRKADSANALIAALSGEEIRWTEQSTMFDDQIQKLSGDCAVASSFISYLGPFNKEFRSILLTRDFYEDCVAKGIPCTKDLQVTRFLVDDAEVGEWNLQGLPSDDLSIQNGIMVTRATRYPVLIDPQGQGLTWLKNREAANSLRVTSLKDKHFRNALEDCLSYGKPLLIENIEEELDPALDPVLEKRFVKKGKGFIIQLADKEVDFADTFALYCTTRLPNPHYSPELSARVTIVDFTVTMRGLEDQLLAKLILKEKRELEQQRVHLVEEVQSYKKKIKQLEDDLLFRLSNSSGNLLDDTELIDVLAVTKKTAEEVSEKLVGANDANVKITEACEEYRPVAHRAAILYFLIAQFSNVNCMYQTSLAQFNALYEQAIDKSDKAAMPSKRIVNVVEYLTYSVYLYVQRGLFERHKIIFSLMLTNNISLSAKKIDPEWVDVFLKGGSSLDINSVKKKPKEWIPDSVWLDIIATSSISHLSDFQDSIVRNDGLWRQWFDLEAPEMGKVPDLEDKLSKFDRMLIIKSMRPDRTLSCANDFIAETLGTKFTESVPLNMEATWAESNCKTPLICLLSAGSDPTKLIEELAKKKKIKLQGVSMGQGQEVIARRLISQAVLEGSWVLLQNTHLGLGYLQEVESFLLNQEISPDFRLWITAEPHPQFPIGLLQMGIKITNEAPVGMKAGLRNSYAGISQDLLESVGRYEWRQLLFAMCFLHSVVQERRKFGPIGWCVRYEFNASDLGACTQFLQNHILEMDSKKASSPTWATVRYMISSIQYGGRITDDFDQLLMDTYANKYFQNSVLEKSYELFPGYNVPDNTEVTFFRQEIEKLRNSESPEIFGLHPNAELTFRLLQVESVVDTILSTMPKSGATSSGLTREEMVDKTCEEFLGKVPAPFKPEETKEKLKKQPGGPSAPLNVHLRQEIDRLNTIIALTTKTLKNLRLAIAGTVALSGGLIDALDSLADGKIPPQWLMKSWESSSLGPWFQGLITRYDQLYKWINATNSRPKAYWLTGFFNPQGFLTAMKQEVNRKHVNDKWALDDVVMTSEVTHPPKEVETLKDAPSEGVYIYGLFLDGCTWSGRENCLVDSEPKKLYSPLPVLYVTGVQAKDKPTDGVYAAPCYKVKKRTGLNFISTFDLKSDDPSSKWIMRGVALLCATD